MNRAIGLVLVVVILAFVVSAAHAAGKTTVDPNTLKKEIAPQQPVGAADARLDAKITYDASGVRLHDVMSEIARVTGATIYCGSSPEDWRVRDIPVTVAARDIPARKLLDFVTYATQTSLTKVKTEKGEFYRVVRNAKLQKKCDDYLAAVENYEKAQAKWSLDVACRLKDIPLSGIKAPKNAGPDWPDTMATQIEISKLLSAMDAGTRNAIFSGDQLVLTPRTAPAGLRQTLLAVLKSMDKAYVKRQNSGRMVWSSDSRMIEPATDDELQNARLGLKLERQHIVLNGVVRASGPDGGFNMRTSYDNISDLASTVLGNMDPSTLPKQPTYPSVPEMDQLSGAKGIWDSPELAEKVAIKLEADGKPKFGGDALIALSNASGLTVVCEDFETVHRERDVTKSFGKESTIQEALAAAGLSARWWVHGESKALIGASSNWVRELRHLVPQRTVDDLTAKADGDGVGFDDLTALMGLAVDFRDYWFRGGTFDGRPFDVLVRPDTKAIWSFYGSLSSWEKELAKSDAGLRLNRYGPRFIAGMLKDYIRTNLDRSALYDFGNVDGAGSGAAFGYSRMLEPAALPTLVMRLKTSEAVYPTFVRPNPPPSVSASSADETKTKSDKPIPPGFTNRRDYYILIEGVDARNKISLQGPYRLPFFSPKREKELSQALDSQNAMAAQPAKN